MHSIYGQTDTEKQALQTESVTSASVPFAVPVLSKTAAQKANDDALEEYNIKTKILKKQKIARSIKYTIEILAGLFLVAYIVFMYKRKMLKKSILRIYISPFGKLFYCTRFCRWDLLGMFIVFSIAFFFAILAGENASRNGYNGFWYAEYAAPVALSIYNIGDTKKIIAEPDSKLDRFLNRGSRGELEFASITNEEAIPTKYTGESYYFETTGLAWLIALWWKLIGHPDWSYIYILFSLFYGATIIAAYFALRQVTGLIPSTLLTLLLSAHPTMMHMFLFSIRDGARALFCYIAIAILLYQLKGGFRWKGTIICSLLLFFICSFSKYLRNDFIVLIPSIIVVVLIFHGKILSNCKKKFVIVLSIILGFTISTKLPGLPRDQNHFGMGHVLYIGMGDYPYMHYLHFSADNYSKCIAYADRYGFMSGAGKAYRERGVINLQPYTKDYDQVCKNEIYSLMRMYPYDFLRLALSSSIQNLYIGSRILERKREWIESAPGYWLFQKKAQDFYSNVPKWLYFVLFSVTLLLFLGGRFYQNMFLCLALMPLCGVYMFQFEIRHYFYLMLISLLFAGFVFNRGLRIPFIIINDWKKVWTFCFKRKKSIMVHCSVLIGLIVLAIGILFVAKFIQTKQIETELENLNIAKTEEVRYETNMIPSIIQSNVSATELILPDFYEITNQRNNPKQLIFNEFLKVNLEVCDAKSKEEIILFAKYKNTADYAIVPRFVGGIIDSTGTCPFRLSFKIENGLNTLFIPVYFARNRSPFIGLEFLAGGKKIDVKSVERIVETDKIRTQSAFLVPNQLEKMQYIGNIDWSKVFWGKQ